MQAGIAAPVSLLWSCASQGHYHMALSNLILKSEAYRAFYKAMSDRGDFVSVDNGVVEEGKPLEFSEVLRAAHMVHAKEVVLPDLIGDGCDSLEETLRGLEWLRAEGCINDFVWLGVPHGTTATEWFYTYCRLLACLEISTIGLSMFDAPAFPKGRPQLVDTLEKLGMVDSERDYHILGCVSDIREAANLNRPWVRSMDTGVPVRLGIKGVWHPRLCAAALAPIVSHRDFDFFGDYLMKEAIQHNIDVYKEACGDANQS